MLADTAALARALRAVPDRFVHGDCHPVNLLRDGDQIVWVDWQGAGIGSPAGDLAGLWERAESDGADPPREAMLAEYVRRRDIDAEALQLCLTATELSSLFFAWPEYARYHSDDEQAKTTQRLIQLTHDWESLLR